MKNKIAALGLALILFISGFLFTACAQPQSNPRIKVKGIATEYYVGDSLDLTNAKIEYYVNQTSIIYDEFDVRASMVEGFSTEEVGNFTMTIRYNTVITTLDYSVLERPDVELSAKEKIALVFENLIAHDKIKEISTTQAFGMSDIRTTITDESVSYSSDNDGTEIWIKEVSGVWYEFEKAGESYTKKEITVPNNDVREYMYDSAVLDMLPDEIEETVDGDTTTYTANIVDPETGISGTFTLVVTNEEVVSITVSAGMIYTTVLNYTYDTNVTDSVPGLPVPFEDWTLVTEEE